MTENEMSLHAIIDRLLDRLERANRCVAAPSVVDKNHPDLVAARAEVIALQAAIAERDKQIIGLNAGPAGGSFETLLRERIADLEYEKRTMANTISELRVWQIGVKRLLRARKVPKRSWPKEPEALSPKPAEKVTS